MPHLRTWSELEIVPASPQVARQTLTGLGATLVRLSIKACVTVGGHSHSFEQFVQIVSGRGWLETEEGRRDFAAGSLFHFPAGTWHAAGFDEDSVLVETNLAETSLAASPATPA